MPFTFYIPGALGEFTAGRSTVEIAQSAATLAEALSALWTLYPGVRDRIATEQGQVGTHQYFRRGRKHPIHRWARYQARLLIPDLHSPGC